MSPLLTLFTSFDKELKLLTVYEDILSLEQISFIRDFISSRDPVVRTLNTSLSSRFFYLLLFRLYHFPVIKP